jgi:hypothetical protein
MLGTEVRDGEVVVTRGDFGDAVVRISPMGGFFGLFASSGNTLDVLVNVAEDEFDAFALALDFAANMRLFRVDVAGSTVSTVAGSEALARMAATNLLRSAGVLKDGVDA